MNRRCVGLHSQALTIVARTERARAVADFVCSALEPRADGAGDENVETPVLAEDAESAEALMAQLTQRLVWNYAQGLALHAAAVERSGRAILFPAVSGGGKSTLAVYLAAHGARFLTDELVFVPTGSGLVHPLARPAHLKLGSLFLLERAPALYASPDVQRYARGVLLAPRVFGESSARAAAPLALGALVFPSYDAEAPSGRLERLSAGVTTYALAAVLVNARNLPGLGLRECARLAQSTPAFRLHYRELSDAEACVDRVAAQLERRTG